MPLDLDLICELAARCGREQALRELLPGRLDPHDPVLVRLHAVDRDNLEWFRRVLDTRGWPGHDLVGRSGAHNAWLLAQHADTDPQFQQWCLDLLGEAVAAGRAEPLQLAYLQDRVHCAQGRPQIYGTQCAVGADGSLTPREIQDPESVDERRRAVGLGPLAAYVAALRRDWSGG